MGETGNSEGREEEVHNENTLVIFDEVDVAWGVCGVLKSLITKLIIEKPINKPSF